MAFPGIGLVDVEVALASSILNSGRLLDSTRIGRGETGRMGIHDCCYMSKIAIAINS